VFDRLLVDADPALNAGNWMWLSCSAFFHQYFRVYSPVSFAQKYDKEGTYVRRWVPALRVR
jgi:cryptochrome